jgi:hypothetical protein
MLFSDSPESVMGSINRVRAERWQQFSFNRIEFSHREASHNTDLVLMQDPVVFSNEYRWID